MQANKIDVLFVVPHFHYDAAHLKTREESIDLSSGILLDMLYLLRKYEDYRFVLDQAVFVSTFLKRYPEQKELLLRMIRNGKIEIVGGMYVQADVNIPSGESFIRQILFGKKYYKEILGIDVKIGWMLDSFGHHPQIPQLMRKAGYRFYCFARGIGKLDCSEFLWEGIDGTKILAHWMPLGYGVAYFPVIEDIDTAVAYFIESYNVLRRYSATGNILALYGTDDVFFKANPNLISIRDKVNAASEKFKIKIATPSEFFDAIKQIERELIVIKGDFNPIFQGCYSARIKLKQYNRILENMLYMCEAFSTIAWILGLQYPEDTLLKAWEPVLFSHFHDVICGTGSDRTYEETIKSYEFAETLLKDMIETTLNWLAERVDTSGHGIPILVFNPLPWKRTDVVSVTVSFTESVFQEFSVKDNEEKEIPYQVESKEILPSLEGLKRVRILFIADNVPALGYKIYRIVPGKGKIFGSLEAGPIGEKVRLELDMAYIENDFFRVEVDQWKGVIKSIKDKHHGWEIINQELPLGNTITKEPDNGDPWEIGAPLRGGGSVSNRIFPFPNPWEADFAHNYGAYTNVSTGPVFAEILIRGDFGKGSRESSIRVYRGIPRIEFCTKLVNNDEWVRYRVVFPTSIKDGKIISEIPFGAIERDAREFCSQNWVDYSDENKGVAFFNRGIPGSSIVNGIFMLSILKCTAIKKYADMECLPLTKGAFEKGIKHTFEYAVMPHTGDWRAANLVRRGLEFNNPLIAIKTTAHKGDLRSEYSFVEVSPDNVVVTAMKKSSDDGIIIRLYETNGNKSEGKIKLFRKIREVYETDLLENEITKLDLAEGAFEFKFEIRGFEIKTFKIRLVNQGYFAEAEESETISKVTASLYHPNEQRYSITTHPNIYATIK